VSKTVTLQLSDDIHELFRSRAAQDIRSLSNFIETAVLRYLERAEYIDEFEMEEIGNNRSLNLSLKPGLTDAEEGRGRVA
jgi:predicted transcriptional regulator